MSPPQVLIAGTGALACALGARLSRAGAAVTLAGTWQSAIERVATHGILVHEAATGEPERTWSAPAAAVPLQGLTGAFPVALVLVKSQQTAAIAPALARCVSASGLVATFQNGLGNAELLTSRLGPERVAVGVAIMGATVLGPGEVGYVPGRVIVGAEPLGAARLSELAALLAAAGVPTEVTPEIARAVWRKLAVNCAVNPLSALHGVPNGELLRDPVLRDELVAASREVGMVASAKGIALGEDAARIALALVQATAANRSSMLQDLARGARTEIDALNGAVVREGRRLGIATPVNERLFRLVRAREGRPLMAEDGP